MKLELDDTQLFVYLINNAISEDEWVQEVEFSINYHVTPLPSVFEDVDANTFLIQFGSEDKTFSIPTGDEQYCSTAEHQDMAFEKYIPDLHDIVKLLKIPRTLKDLYAVTTPDVHGTDEARMLLDKMWVEEDWA